MTVKFTATLPLKSPRDNKKDNPRVKKLWNLLVKQKVNYTVDVSHTHITFTTEEV